MDLKPYVALAMLTIVLVLAACGEGGERRSVGKVASERTDVTLAEVYEHMEQAITREGHVFHTRIETVSVQHTFPTPTPEEKAESRNIFGDLSGVWYELWLEPATATGRVEHHYVSGDGPAVSSRIVTRDEAFRVNEGQSAETSALLCRGSDSSLLAQLMMCGNYLEESHTRVMSATYDGRDVIALLTEGDLPSHDWTSPFTNTLYVDPDTWLPIANESHSEIPESDDRSFELEYFTVYKSEFIPRSSLADDFFQPSALGYVPRDPEASLKKKDPGIPVYWLGTEFDGGGSLPTLQIQSSGVHADRDPRLPRLYLVNIEYGDAGDEHGPPIIGMQEWATAEWEAFLAQSRGGNAWDEPGVVSEEIALADGRALLYRMAGRWGGDRYLAHVYLPGTMIMVMDFDSPSLYNNREGFLAVIHGLVERR